MADGSQDRVVGEELVEQFSGSLSDDVGDGDDEELVEKRKPAKMKPAKAVVKALQPAKSKADQPKLRAAALPPPPSRALVAASAKECTDGLEKGSPIQESAKKESRPQLMKTEEKVQTKESEPPEDKKVQELDDDLYAFAAPSSGPSATATQRKKNVLSARPAHKAKANAVIIDLLDDDDD